MGLQLYKAFEDASTDSQVVFRQLLKIMSEPGHIEAINIDATAPSSVYNTTWAVAQTLLDADCNVSVLPSLQEQKMIQSLQFFTDCSIESNYQKANFTFLSIRELQQLNEFNTGTLEAPHESCTLIVQTPVISYQPQLLLSGPGIKTQRSLTIADLSSQQIDELQKNHQLYPCGLDIIFCSPGHITALPRSTTISPFTSVQEIA